MATGFVLKLNLQESNTRDKDELALDNLGGSGISDDIGLFANNLRNFDFINPDDIVRDDATQSLTIVSTSSKVAFANRNLVTHNGTTYSVVDSDSNKTFSLKDGNGNYLLANEITSPLVRSLAITFNNLQNINPQKQEVINAPDVLVENLIRLQQLGIFNYGLEPQSIYDRSLGAYIETAEQLSGDFNIIRSKTFFTPLHNIKRDEFTSYNSIFVVNDNDEDILQDNTPGIYVQSGDGTKARVGGVNVDPWTTLPNRTITQATQTTMRDLYTTDVEFTGDITVDTISEPTDVRTTFTHKMKCIINGQVYNLLVTEETT